MVRTEVRVRPDTRVVSEAKAPQVALEVPVPLELAAMPVAKALRAELVDQVAPV